MRAQQNLLVLSSLLVALLPSACGPAEAPSGGAAYPVPPPPDAASARPEPRLDALGRLEYNQLAVELALPLFWESDDASPGVLEPAELAVLWGRDTERAAWVSGDAFTPAFHDAYASMVRAKARGDAAPEGLDPAEVRRRAAVVRELRQGRPTLLRSDFRAASAEDRAIVTHVLAAAAAVERIYQKQLGSAGLTERPPPDDTASRALLFRNQSPWCHAPKTESDPDCNALPSRPKRVSGLYPAKLQETPRFCETLEARKDGQALLHQFAVVDDKDGELRAVPYHVAYATESKEVARELDAAAAAIQSPGEAALKAYLAAAAAAFRDGEWEKADEAWAKMSVHNSKWYLRIGPDEVYFEPCSRKAGFHTGFARINQDSLTWQKKLEPLKSAMEAEMARLAGPPYKAREVSFHLPDFIDIVLNAGDARDPLGATIGQSLPNWGPVANEGRGRTVAMTNINTDTDSLAALREQVESLYCPETMAEVSLEPSLAVMTTVLHEAAHNLGPAHEYKVRGKTSEHAFGGPLASMLEELKAQTAALYFSGWLADKGVIDQKTAKLAYLRDVAWAFGHVALGVYTSEGKPRPYSQLAAIQLGALLDAGAVEWRADATAANGKDRGCFAVHTDKFAPVVNELARTVFGIKGRGDKPAAEKLKAKHVDADTEWKKLRAVVEERWLRVPKASFVYAIEK